MKKLTITWVGQPKIIQTKFGPKQKFSIKAREEGDKFMDVWLKETDPIWKVGEIHEGEVVPREYNGKTYYDFKLPRMSARQNEEVLKAISNLDSRVTKLLLLNVEIGKALNVESLRSKVPGTDIDYPTHEGEPNFEPKEEDSVEHINEDEIPF